MIASAPTAAPSRKAQPSIVLLLVSFVMESGIGALALVDHHVHPALEPRRARAEFEALLTESDRPLPPG